MAEPPILLSKWYEFTKWLLGRVDQYPKNQRFILGQRLVDGALDIQECVVEAAYSRDDRRRDQLTGANRKVVPSRTGFRFEQPRCDVRRFDPTNASPLVLAPRRSRFLEH